MQAIALSLNDVNVTAPEAATILNEATLEAPTSEVFYLIFFFDALYIFTFPV